MKGVKVTTEVNGVEKEVDMDALKNQIDGRTSRKPKEIYEAKDSKDEWGEVESKYEYEITNATIKDGYCIYEILYTRGKDKGRTGKFSDRKHVILKDLEQAYATFNRHLAVTDDVFIIGKEEVLNIDSIVDHDYCEMYDVSSFVVKGSEENRSIILSGYKRLSLGGTINYTSQRIDLDDTSRYKFAPELKLAMDVVREEVSLYHEGKYMLAEEDKPDAPTPYVDPSQYKMSFTSPEGIRQDEKDADEKDADDFANAEVL